MSWKLEQTKKYTITACWAKVKFSFSLDVGRIIGNCNFSIVLMETSGIISPVKEGANFFWFFGSGNGGRDQTVQCNACGITVWI